MHDHWVVHSALPAEDKMNHYPMTEEQREGLDHDLATIMEKLGDTAILLNACYGDRDQGVERAQAAQAAVQRLLWALEREPVPITIGNAGGSARVREMVKVSAKGNRAVAQSSRLNEVKWIDDLTFLANLEER